MSEIIEGVNVAANHMRGALVKLFVELLKETGTWQKATQAEQEKILQRADEMAAATVSESVRIIAADSRPHILAKVKGVNFKAGVEASIFVDKTNPHRHDLADHVGQEILVVMPYGDRYQGANSGVRSEPNNKAMFDADGAPVAEAAAGGKGKGKGSGKGKGRGKNKDAEPAPAPEFQRADDSTQKLLMLADYNVPLQVIATWTDDQVKAAEMHASDAHYAAADDNAVLPEPPEFLLPYRSGTTLGNADTSDAGQLSQALDGLQEPDVHTDNGRDPLLTQEACERMGIVVPIDAIEKWPLETLMRVEKWCEQTEASAEGDEPPMPSELLRYYNDTNAAAKAR